MADAPNTEITDDLSFDLAFDAAVSGTTPTEEPPVEPEVDEQPPVEASPPAEETPPVEEPVVEASPPPAAEPPKPAPPVQEASPPPTPEPPPLPSEYAPSDEELQQIEAVKSEFPEVATALSIYEKVLTSKFEKVLAEKINEVHAQYAPVVATTQRIARNEHEATILAKHADAFNIANDVSAWVSQQPSILRNSYATVLQNGSAAEVVELLDMYKQAVKPPVTPPQPEPPKVDAEKERKLQALEGVRSRNTSERAALDPDDFDGAFEKFAAKA